MPKATSLTITDRRTFLGQIAGISAAASAGIMAGETATHTDADLISLCRQFDALQDEINSFYDGGYRYISDDHERDQAIEPIAEQQEALLDDICALPALSHAGCVARARTFVKWWPHVLQKIEAGFSWDDRMVGALLRDLTANT